MKTIYAVLLPICLLAVGCAKKTESETDSAKISQNQNEEKFDSLDIEADTEFAVNAADGGRLEVRLGELAQSNASNPQVKKFGQQMIDDHGKANAELQTLTQQKNISIPGTLSDDKQEKYDELSKKYGAEFDKAYAEYMVKDHKEDIDLFEKQADKGKDTELKSWASEKIPTLKHHLQMAEETEKIVKK